MSGFENAVAVLPQDIRRLVVSGSPELRSSAMEFRMRIGKPPTVLTADGETCLDEKRIVSAEDLNRMLEIATGASPYRASAVMEKGFIMAPGGVRIGLCGQRVDKGNGVKSWGALTSAAIRIPHEMKGCAAAFCGEPPVSTLIVGPPGHGKTTLLRDMVRIYSDKGYRIGLCDEREELAAAGSFGTGFDVGVSTDVISGLSKGAAAFQLLRTMNPQIIAMDEITEQADAAGCSAASRCGVLLFATAHADSGMSFRQNNAAGKLVHDGLFQRIIGTRFLNGKWEYETKCLF